VKATPDLSPREIDVLRLTAIGHSNKSIANTLHQQFSF
jgi:DNA-binding CsgD family transcriptional regulator